MKANRHRKLDKKCPDCGKSITDVAAYCRNCAKKGARNPLWGVFGKEHPLWKPNKIKDPNRFRRLNKKCTDCGCPITDRAIYCVFCAKKGERNHNWKRNKPENPHRQLGKNCPICGDPMDDRSMHCKLCIPRKGKRCHTSESIAKMMAEERLYDSGNRCLGCNKPISRKAKRCRICAGIIFGGLSSKRGALTVEVRCKIGEAHKGRKLSPKHCRAISDAKKGKLNPMWGKKGPLHPNWKGCKTTANEYILIYDPQNPMTDVHGYVYEHRKVMAEVIGRSLLSSENVHHINGNKKDNRPANLMLFSSMADHLKFARKQYRWRRF